VALFNVFGRIFILVPFQNHHRAQAIRTCNDVDDFLTASALCGCGLEQDRMTKERQSPQDIGITVDWVQG